ncbi:MAG: Cys-Gln thioester bond-forming surface protein [Phycisphaerales bacterium]|nr:Cys-Gln thioester bond-forming surface protein [Phycisphaerales bacterium]
MKTCTITAVALVAAFAASNASAATVDVKFTGTGKGSNVRMYVNNGSGQNVFAGQLKHTLSNAQSPYETANGNKITFCTDLTQYVSSNTSQYEFAPISAMPDSAPMGADKAAAIQKIYNGANGLQLTSSVSNEFAAAFQLAVWEIVTDYNPNVGTASMNLGSGNFKAKKTNGNSLTGGIVTAFNTIMGYINQGYNEDVKLVGITSDRKQDQLVEGTCFVPAPGAAALAAMGLGLVTLRRRK